MALRFAVPSFGIIPAYAGNTFGHSISFTGNWDHPPRMRGTRDKLLDRFDVGGIIPAYAGNTLRDYSNFVVSKFMSFVFHLV